MLDLPLMSYVAAMSVTPGPNNLMLAASGVNFGFRRTVPHLFGISAGHSAQVTVIASALAWVLIWLNSLRGVLVIAGCSYLLWLAWKQMQAGQPGQRESAQPLGFWGAALFQWVNPKAWMMVLNVALLFLPVHATWQDALQLGVLCGLVNLPCICVWALAGDQLRHWMHHAWVLRTFNYTMAALLAATAVWIMWEEGGRFLG